MEQGTLSEVSFGTHRDAAVAFGILAELDLGRDAANLHHPGSPVPPWAGRLATAYHAAPSRLQLHGWPLRCEDGTLAARLSRWAEQCPDPRDRTLVAIFLEIYATRAESIPTWAAPPYELLPVWASLREALWAAQGQPPPLRVLDCPPLGRHGRGTSMPHGRVVATSLAEPREHVLCQVLHEEVHAITDPAMGATASRDTRFGQPGFALHAELEIAAVEVGEALLRARAPAWLPAYARWRVRSGTPTAR